MKFTLIALAASMLCGAAANAQVVYSSESGTANNTPNAAAPTTQYVHYLESVTLAGTGPVTLGSLEVSVHFNSYTAGSQDIYAFIYTGSNLASTTGITATGTERGYGSTVAQVPLLANRTPTNDYFYSFSLTSVAGLTFTAGTQIQVEFALTLDDPTGTLPQFANSNEIVGNFSAGGVATVGTNSTGGVFTNTDNSTDFVVSDLRSSQSVRFALRAVPEPSSLMFSAIAGCVLLGSVIRLRGSRVAA